MKRYKVNSFRCSGKTTNAIAVALTFASCGKKVDYLVHHPHMIQCVKDIIKNKYGFSGNPLSLWCVWGYTPDADTDVVICDECSSPPNGWTTPNLTVIEYGTSDELASLTNNIPNFMSIYIKLIMDEINSKAPNFNKPKKEEPSLAELTKAISNITNELNCTVDQALAIIKFSQGNGN